MTRAARLTVKEYVAGRRSMAVYHCESCGAALLVTERDLGHYDSDTGRRSTTLRGVCPNRRWYKPWHESAGMISIAPPPPPHPIGRSA